MADERQGSTGSRENKPSGEETVRRERITGRDFAGADFAANEQEQTRDVRAADMVGEERPDEPLESGPVRRHDEEIGVS